MATETSFSVPTVALLNLCVPTTMMRDGAEKAKERITLARSEVSNLCSPVFATPKPSTTRLKEQLLDSNLQSASSLNTKRY